MAKKKTKVNKNNKRNKLVDWKFVVLLISLLMVGLSVFALSQRVSYKSRAEGNCVEGQSKSQGCGAYGCPANTNRFCECKNSLYVCYCLPDPKCETKNKPNPAKNPNPNTPNTPNPTNPSNPNLPDPNTPNTPNPTNPSKNSCYRVFIKCSRSCNKFGDFKNEFTKACVKKCRNDYINCVNTTTQP